MYLKQTNKQTLKDAICAKQILSVVTRASN